MSNIAILGHPTRGKEVIEILEMFGGKNHFNLDGAMDNYYYYIDENSNKIYHCLSINPEYGIVFTIEEFEEKFPYKVGDKVIYEDKIREITKMVWEEQTNTIAYKLDDKLYCNVINDLQPYKEENYCQVIGNDTSSNGVNTSASSIDEEPEPEPEPKAPILSNRYDYAEGKCGYVIPDGYEFDSIKEGFQTEIILKPKKPTYPKTYEELIKPKFKVGDKIKYKNGKNIDGVEQGVIISITDDTYDVAVTNDMGIFVPITDQYEWELIPNKFDIVNLKPFEKVLVRQNVNGKWGIDFFGFYTEGYYYTTGSCIYVQCIPYEGNEHLLGTTNDCDECFKNWK